MIFWFLYYVVDKQFVSAVYLVITLMFKITKLHVTFSVLIQCSLITWLVVPFLNNFHFSSIICLCVLWAFETRNRWVLYVVLASNCAGFGRRVSSGGLRLCESTMRALGLSWPLKMNFELTGSQTLPVTDLLEQRLRCIQRMVSLAVAIGS